MSATAPRTDPITLEVLRNKLDLIADEMESTLLRVSHSSIVKNAEDATAALFDPSGNTLAQSSANPGHLQMLIPAVNKIIEEIPPAAMQPDDIYIMNDPYDGGTHLPDITLLMPIFVEDEVVALACTMAHHQDVGGKAPGSTPPDATEIFAEGIIIPVLKLYDRGSLNEGLLKLLRRNVRVPESFTGDLMAQVACCKTGVRRILDLFAEYGKATMLRYYDELYDYAERMARASIESIPDGEYSFYDYVDGNGVEPNAPLKIQITVRVKGSELSADFTGCDPEAKGGINCVPASSATAVFFVVRAVGGPDVPNNAGAYRPISVYAPLGTVANARHPHAVGARAIVVRRMAGVMQGALVQAIPDRIPAAAEGASNLQYVGGLNPRTGRRFVTIMGIPTNGGSGARPDRDGVNVISSDITNLKKVPLEAFELDFPFRVVKCDTWLDSAGPGRWRGGQGYHAIVEVLADNLTVTIRRDRHSFQPWGLFGGRASPCNRIVIHRADGRVEEMPSTAVVEINSGDRIESFATGGAGYGDPLEREPWRVRDDVLDRAVSREAAEAEYGVVLRDPELEVDEAATAARRGQLRAERGPITWTFDRGAAFHERTGLPRHQ